jgi:hypothetical protein
MRSLLVVLTVLGMFAALGSAPVIAQDETGAVVERTDTRYFLPFNQDGLDADLAVSAEVSGVCHFDSLHATGRPDAWECQGDDNTIYDPCFENPFTAPEEESVLACSASPLSNEVVLLTLEEPLVRDKEAAPEPASQDWAYPWALELENGATCLLQSEIDVVLGGQAVHYSCADGGMVLGVVDRGFPVWTVNYLASGEVGSNLTEVVAAWS